MPHVWIRCKHCNKKLLKVEDDTVIVNLPLHCKACKKISDIQFNTQSQEPKSQEPTCLP